MTTSDEALQTAVGHHQAGRLQQAAEMYKAILAGDPKNPHALHLLGLVAHQRGQHDTAVTLISAAIRREGGNALFHNNLGEAQRACGNLAAAKASYLEAIRLDPRMPLAYYNLALAHWTENDVQAALERCRQAVAVKPDYLDAHELLARSLRAQGDSPGAQAALERVLAIDPSRFDALANLGRLHLDAGQFQKSGEVLQRALAIRPNSADLHVQMGQLETAQKRWPPAIAWLQTATRLDPRSAEAELQLAMALQLDGQVANAIEHYRRSIELAPGSAMAHYNLGTALELTGRRAEATEQFLATLKLDPQFPGADTNLGAYHHDAGNLQRALAHYDRAIQIRPDAAKAHFNRALILLTRGDLAAGWPDFEWRVKLPAFPVQTFDLPRWQGEEIGDKTLLVHAEQGLGDTLQFIRYVPIVGQRAGHVVSLVNPALVPLLRQSGYDVAGNRRELPRVDYQIPIMSMPGAVGTTLANVPAEIPYLSAEQSLVAAWQDRLCDMPGFRVGICWQGNAAHAGDPLRSVGLDTFAPLAAVEGVRLVSLQKGAGEEQLAALAGRFEVCQLGPDFDSSAGPFMDTAAVIKHLDLVITVDTVVAHLAGALGANVWVALGARPDWRWLHDRSDSPWYPTMRLFRQTKPHDWSELFERMAGELRVLIECQSGGSARA